MVLILRLATLPQDDRLASLPQDDRLAALPQDDRLAALPQDDRLAALPQDDRLAGMISALLFDVDDTLVDTQGAFRHALSTVAAHYLTAVPSADELTATWRSDEGGFYRAHTRGEMTHREQRMRRANALHVIYGGPVMNDAEYDAWDADFEQAFKDGWRPHDDAAAALDVLDQLGIPYGALSNAATAYQELKLAACGLERVPMLVGVDTLGFGKPDPRVFALACELLGEEPEHVAYIGDEYDIDALAASQAGLRGIWLDRGASHSVGPVDAGVERITTLASLENLIR